MALHRLSRLLTYSLCGEAYLTFMGNEFGHPEWIDLPREGNGHSLERARRRWDLADDPKLRYGQLYDFEVAMHRVHDSHPWLDAPAPTSRGDGTIGCCEQKQCLWFGWILPCLSWLVCFTHLFQAHIKFVLRRSLRRKVATTRLLCKRE